MAASPGQWGVGPCLVLAWGGAPEPRAGILFLTCSGSLSCQQAA